MIDAYVLGFMLDRQRQNVALIRKNHPEWQSGKLNGIGGRINTGESPAFAMIRKFAEETGTATLSRHWLHYGLMHGPYFSVDLFATIPKRHELSNLRSVTSEQVEIHNIYNVIANRTDIVESLPWLILLAIDCLNDHSPAFADIRYQ